MKPLIVPANLFEVIVSKSFYLALLGLELRALALLGKTLPLEAPTLCL
jgi:hypothetical protein